MPPLWYSQLEKLNAWRLKDRKSVQLFQLKTPIKETDVHALLYTKQLPPHGHEFILQQWCDTPPKAFLHQLLERADAPISAQILALKVIQCQPTPDDLKSLWTVFFESRFGLRAEDPDLFERALDIILTIEETYPHSSQPLMVHPLPEIFAKGITHRDGIDVDVSLLKALLMDYEKQYGKQGFAAFASEEGSMFQELVNALQQKEHQLPKLPHHKPAQHLDIAHTEPYVPPVKYHSPALELPIIVWAFITAGGSFLWFKRSFWPKLGVFGFSLAILMGLEGICTMLEVPSLSEQKPLFSLVDWDYKPYQTIARPSGNWWISDGGPARWQEIPQKKSGWRFAVLGASSAHGSNLLQEQSFAGLLQKDLQEKYPDTPVQVVNLAIGGTTSNGVLQAGVQALNMDCDALIIYYGHNEVAQFQTLENLGGSDNIELRIQLYQSRLYSTLSRIFSHQSNTPTLKISTQHDVSELRSLAIYNHHYNLSALLQKSRTNHVPVLLIAPSYNYRFAPYTPIQDSPPVAQQWLEKAKSLRVDSPQKALEATRQTISVDKPGGEARLEALRIQAELHAQMGVHKEARRAYQQLFDEAKETTTVHSGILDNITNLAQYYGTAYLDATSIFYHHAPDGITANGIFWDELHPSAQGHRYLAQAISPWLETIMEPAKTPNSH